MADVLDSKWLTTKPENPETPCNYSRKYTSCTHPRTPENTPQTPLTGVTDTRVKTNSKPL